MSDKQKKAVKKKAVEGREAEPKAAGKEPALGAIGYFLAIIFTALVFISHIRSKKKKR